MKNPMISIVMPAYNVGSVISESIDSVLNQTYQEWELIIVDDGSTDNTSEVVRYHNDERISFFRQENMGAASARNFGIEKSKGEFLSFLDSDDRYTPFALENLYKALTVDVDACVAYGEGIVIDENGMVYGKPAVFSHRPSGYVLEDILQYNFILNGGAICVRRQCLLKSGLYNPDIKVAHDWELWCRLANVGKFIYIGNKPVIEYRIWDGGISRNMLDNGVSNYLPALDAVYSNSKLREKYNDFDLNIMRKHKEARLYSRAGTENLRNKNWDVARVCFIKSLRRNLINPRDIILYVFSVLHFLPQSLLSRLK